MQKVKAFVVLRPGCEPSDAVKQEILDYCRQHIAKYAMPYDIEFRPELPKTLVGKVAYRVLEEEEAERQAAILKAEGEAQAILNVQKALADSIKMLNEANPNDQVVKIKALESFEKAADGQATKIIVPSEIQSLAGLAASFKGLLEDEKK